MNFGEDPCHLNIYLNAWHEFNEIHKINKMSYLSHEDYLNFLGCQATSCKVERSISMLNELLEKDRNFTKKTSKLYYGYI